MCFLFFILFLSSPFPLQVSPSPPLPVSLSLEDSELLSFYSSQSLAHLSCLADSIDLLFSSVQGNQPPRVFVSRGKSLIVTAHKLVFIGDTLSRLLTSPDLRTKVGVHAGQRTHTLQNYGSTTEPLNVVCVCVFVCFIHKHTFNKMC